MITRSNGQESVGEAALRGGLWGAGASALSIAASIITSIFTARYLSPEDFAILAIVAAMIGLSDRLWRLGLAEMVVTEKENPELLASQVFTVLIIFAALEMAVLGGASSFWSGLYRMPALKYALPAASLGLAMATLSSLPRALLERQLKFGVINQVEIANRMLAAVATVCMLFLGLRYWAVILGGLLAGTASSAAYFILSGFKRLKPSGISLVLDRLGFGIGIFMIGVLDYLGEDLDYFLLGRYLPARDFGTYYFAYSRARQPWRLLGSSANAPLLAAFSKITEEKSRFEAGVVRAVSFYFWVFAACGAYLAILADQLIPVVFGNHWSDSAWICSLFFLLMIPVGLEGPAGIPLISFGKSLHFVPLVAIRVAVLLIALLLGMASGWGLTGIVISVFTSMVAVRLWIAWRAYRMVGIPTQQLASACLVALSPILATSFLFWLVREQIPWLEQRSLNSLLASATLISLLHLIFSLILAKRFLLELYSLMKRRANDQSYV